MQYNIYDLINTSNDYNAHLGEKAVAIAEIVGAATATCRSQDERVRFLANVRRIILDAWENEINRLPVD